jgi:D-aspartate ligase
MLMKSPRSESAGWAVVVGADAHGLGIARSLAKGNVSVVIVDDSSLRPGMHSRYVRPFIVGTISGPGLVDGLLALQSSPDERPVLFVTSDGHVRVISEHRERLAQAFRIRLPRHETTCELLHKIGFQVAAERHGFPVPRAVRVCTESDLPALGKLTFPGVVKPAEKRLALKGRALRARKVLSRHDAEAVCRDFLPTVPDLIVQEWIEGAESDIYFCLQYRGDDGTTVRSFTGRKLRCWPPQTGSTASCTAAPELESVIEPLTRAFFDKTEVVGLCSMEFKRERSTGKLFMIEPTIGRTDWQEEVAALHGVNIPLAACLYELQLPVPLAERTRRPLIWRDPSGYWRSALVRRLPRGDRGPPGAAVKSACWRNDDPVPLAFFWLEWIRKGWRPAAWRPE